MSAIILFMAGIAAIAGWWLSQQRLTAKPWLEEGVIVDWREESPSSVPPAKIGLGVFLAVVGSLFALFISAYSMRMNMVDWRALPMPRLLWFNTGVLVLSSVCGAAMGTHGRAPERHRRCHHRRVRRRSIRRHIPGWAAPGVAPADRRGVF